MTVVSVLLQASIYMMQRDGLARLLRGSELANRRLQLALRSKEGQRKGLAQHAQVGLPHAASCFIPP